MSVGFFTYIFHTNSISISIFICMCTVIIVQSHKLPKRSINIYNMYNFQETEINLIPSNCGIDGSLV